MSEQKINFSGDFTVQQGDFMDFKEVKIAVLLPCFNEELAIKAVVENFYKALPDCTVYVYDNASTDNTREVARSSGAIVRFEPRKGKGNVVRRMFADIEADVYILSDGDLTYEAEAAPKLVNQLLKDQLDMVVGTHAPMPEMISQTAWKRHDIPIIYR